MIIYEKRDVGLKPRPITWEGLVIQRGENVYVKLSPGTVNGLLPSNWQSELDVTGEEIKYISLKVFSRATGNNVTVTGAELVVNEEAPESEDPTEDAPPATFEILLGIYNQGVYRSIYNKPLFVYPSVFITEPKEDPEAFAYPFTKYFVWEVIS